MKRRQLTAEEQLWDQVHRIWPHAMEYEHIETPFDAPSRQPTEWGIALGRAWLASRAKQARLGQEVCHE